MTEFTFSDNELRLAAINARNAILASLPEPESCKSEFSITFLEKMNMLLRLDKKRTVHKRRIRRLVAAILALMIAAAALITFNSAARATVIQWVREVYKNSILYRFAVEKAAAVLPDCEIGWIPEGYAETNAYKDNDLFSALYENKTGESIIINYYFMQDGTLHDILLEDGVEYAHKEISINGNSADYYEALDHSDSNDLIVFDETHKIVLHISGFLDEKAIVRIAENFCFK